MMTSFKEDKLTNGVYFNTLSIKISRCALNCYTRKIFWYHLFRFWGKYHITRLLSIRVMNRRSLAFKVLEIKVFCLFVA